MRPKASGAEESYFSSSRFHRFFIRGSRDEIFEVGEEALASESAQEGDGHLDRSIRKSLSIGSLFAWRQRKSEVSSPGENEEVSQSGARSMPKRVLTALAESPQHGDARRRGLHGRFKSKLPTTDGVGRAPRTVVSLSKGQDDDESRKINPKVFSLSGSMGS